MSLAAGRGKTGGEPTGAVQTAVKTAAHTIVQTIEWRDGTQAGQAYFSVAGQAELRAALAAPTLVLSATELAHWQALRVENKRHSALQGRIAAKRALAAALGEDNLHNIVIERGTFGQPLVRHLVHDTRAGASAAGVEVTLSHSNGIAVALAYPDALPMGIDVETVSPAAAQTVLGELQLSAEERAWLAQGQVDQATACAMLWSAREALGKSMKTGLNCPLGVLALSAFSTAGGGGGAAALAGGSPESLDSENKKPDRTSPDAVPAAQAWQVHYRNFPQSQCWLQVGAGRVLALALPRTVRLACLPQMPPAAG